MDKKFHQDCKTPDHCNQYFHCQAFGCAKLADEQLSKFIDKTSPIVSDQALKGFFDETGKDKQIAVPVSEEKEKQNDPEFFKRMDAKEKLWVEWHVFGEKTPERDFNSRTIFDFFYSKISELSSENSDLRKVNVRHGQTIGELRKEVERLNAEIEYQRKNKNVPF